MARSIKGNRRGAHELLYWAGLGATLRPEADSRSAVSPLFGTIFGPIIAEANALRQIERKEFSKLLSKSRRLLHPFGEPLEQNFGLNRWLFGAREEVYSDWLHWLFSEMEIQDFIGVLGLSKLRQIAQQGRVLGEREIWIDKNSDDETAGRLDIIVRLPNKQVIILEIKKADAGSLALDQVMGYANQLRKNRFLSDHEFTFLLLSKAAQERRSGVEVRDYYKFCRNLRRLAMRWVEEKKLLQAATCLMVAGSIEVNLLEMRVSATSFTPSAKLQLDKFQSSTHYER
jgi:hypothetical protein